MAPEKDLSSSREVREAPSRHQVTSLHPNGGRGAQRPTRLRDRQARTDEDGTAPELAAADVCADDVAASAGRSRSADACVIRSDTLRSRSSTRRLISSTAA